MTVDPSPARPNLIMEISKSVGDRWVAISAALAALGSLLTFFLLFTYPNAEEIEGLWLKPSAGTTDKQILF